MALTAAGINFIASAITGGGTFFNSSTAHIGVGNGSATFSTTHTDLTGSSKLRKAVDAGYPIISPPSLTFCATFGRDEANFDWNEWAIFNAKTGGVMLNRAVEYNGTKQDNQTWVLEVVVTFTVNS